MADPVKRERPQTIKEMRDESSCWERYQAPPHVLFWISAKHAIGVPFSSIGCTQYIEREDGSRELVIEWKDNDGNAQVMYVTGPKVNELIVQLSIQTVSEIRSDGKDITRVDLLPPGMSMTEEQAQLVP